MTNDKTIAGMIVTKEELTVLKENARKKGYSVSDYLRSCALLAPTKVRNDR